MKKLISKINIRSTLVLAVFFVLTVSFQNCAKNEFVFEDASVTKMLDYFEYHYTKATPIYYDVVFTQESQNGSNNQYTFYVMAATSDSSVEIFNYEARIYNSRNVQICTTVTGDIGTENMASFQCSASNAEVISHIELKVKKSSQQDWTTYVKKYN